MDGVVEEHPAHRPEPRSRLRKLAPRPEDPGQGDGGGGEPDDHPDDQNPWRGRDDARNGDAQPEVPESKCPDGHPPVSVGPQPSQFVHTEWSTWRRLRPRLAGC